MRRDVHLTKILSSLDPGGIWHWNHRKVNQESTVPQQNTYWYRGIAVSPSPINAQNTFGPFGEWWLHCGRDLEAQLVILP